jgi:serine O-acetyltransferase
MDKRMQSMCITLKAMGADEDFTDIPEIDSCEIISTADELKPMDENRAGEEGRLSSM